MVKEVYVNLDVNGNQNWWQKNNIQRLESMFSDKRGVLFRQMVNKIGISKSYVHKVVKIKLKLQYRKKDLDSMSL